MHKTLKNQLSVETLLQNKQWREQFNKNQIDEIRRGLKENLNVSIYADPKFNVGQMYQLRWGLKQNIDVSIYADPKLNAEQMFEIQTSLKKKHQTM